MFTPQYKKIIGLSVLGLMIVLAAVVVFAPAGFPGRRGGGPIEVTIPKGAGLIDIATILHDKGLVWSKPLFEVYVVVSGHRRDLKAGVYTFSNSLSISNLVGLLVEGSHDEEISVTIPEGSNIDEIDAIFAASGLLPRRTLLSQVYIDQEGFLFPDTYRFAKDTPVAEIIDKLRDNFTLKTSTAFFVTSQSERFRILTIASILEKEVRKPEDMALVAGIIQNRLKRRMALAIDATVAYGVCREQWAAGKPCDVTGVNLIASIPNQNPYNTYRNQGLPPGPISNPGVISLKAALNPKPNDYLFYLTDPKTGDTIFSKTAIEHERNRQKYLGR